MENEKLLVENSDVVEQSAETTKHKKRYKIDKLMGLKDIRYRGILSGRTMKIVGFIFMFFTQIYFAANIIDKFKPLSDAASNFADVLDVLGLFALPAFLAANFCVIMTNKAKIKKVLLTYSIIAVGIYLLVLFVFYRYIYGLGKVFNPDDAHEAYLFADMIAKKLFGKVINYNVFVDLALFSMLYYFLFYTPKKLIKKKSIIAFRSLSALPIILAAIATILYGLYSIGFIELPVAVLAILPCRSLTVYVIFFGIAFIVKLRQHLFMKWGGTEEEYNIYAKSNRSSLEISVVSSVVLLIVSLLDFALFMAFPWVFFFGLGLNFYLAFSIPFIMLLSYTRKTKASIWDAIMVAVFIFAVIILYLEMGLYILK